MALSDLLQRFDQGKSKQFLGRDEANTGGVDAFASGQAQLNYGAFLNSREEFRKAGVWREKDEFNLHDVPSHKYFKILFYFDDTSENGTGKQGGLLAPTWEVLNSESYNLSVYNHNSAWSYLKMNGENERADMLKQFICLLSNINTYSPWYFQSISGVEAAMERKQTMERDFKIDDERKMLSITCLPDSFDNRIGTLLDLYRTVVWSWQTKREILPSNLRKFDMAIYLYESPIYGFHDIEGSTDNNTRHMSTSRIDFASLDSHSSSYITSYKYLEFHNCEIDYNSTKTGYENLTNVEGITQTYTINIYYDDCFEQRYNEFTLKTIGDIIALDTVKNVAGGLGYFSDINDVELQAMVLEPLPPGKNITASVNFQYNYDSGLVGINTKKQNIKNYNRINDRLQSLRTTGNIPVTETWSEKMAKKISNKLSGALETAATEVVGYGVNKAKSFVKRALLGNIHSMSLTKFADDLGDALSGQVVSTTSKIIQAKNNQNSRENGRVDYELGSLYDKNLSRGAVKGRQDLGEIYNINTSDNLVSNNDLGNIFKKKVRGNRNIIEANTLANNI